MNKHPLGTLNRLTLYDRGKNPTSHFFGNAARFLGWVSPGKLVPDDIDIIAAHITPRTATSSAKTLLSG
jgi:hypothetical protein